MQRAYMMGLRRGRRQARKELPFPRGYHIEIRGGRRMPDMSIGGQLGGEMLTTGPALRAQARRMYGSTIVFSGRGEMIPNDDCYCEIDPTVPGGAHGADFPGSYRSAGR